MFCEEGDETWDIHNSLKYEEDNALSAGDGSDYSNIEANKIDNYELENSNSEQSADSDIEVDVKETYYRGKDKTSLWSKHPLRPKTARTRKHNISKLPLPGPTPTSLDIMDVLASWKLFFSDKMIDRIVMYTNTKIRQVSSNYSRGRDARETDPIEIKAFLGLLYLAGLNQSNHQNALDLWRQDGSGIEIFRLVMGLGRFRFLLQTLRFDDVSDPRRNKRKIVDKLTYIREIFEEFVSSCKQHYHVGQNVTVDEVFSGFRGRCSFRVYMPKKPERYGIKFWACTDATTSYCSNLEVFVGKQNVGPYHIDNSASEVVKRMVGHLVGSNRNVTCSSYFTSISLSKDLLNMGFTMVGEIKKNKAEIPSLFIANRKKRAISSSIFGFSHDSTLLSFKSQKDKIVLFLSTLHNLNALKAGSEDLYKPDIVTFYDTTKSGVDELQKSYSVSRVASRWPLCIFFTLMNIGAVNSFIIYRTNTNNEDLKSSVVRRTYLRELSIQLMNDHAKRRFYEMHIPAVMKSRLGEIFNIPELKQQEKPNAKLNTKTLRCAYCRAKKNRKTKTRCVECAKPICREHTKTICVNCFSHFE